jgi:hypothetical protein
MLPIMFSVFASGTELVNYAMAMSQVSHVGMTVSDNIGRIMTNVDESDIYEAFEAADKTAGNLDFKLNGKIVVSSLKPNDLTGSSAGQTINWQRCYGGLKIGSQYGKQGDGATSSALAQGLGPAGNKIKAALGTAVMFVEVTYTYQPMIFPDIVPAQTIKYETAFNVRGRVNQNISNAGSLAVNSC